MNESQAPESQEIPQISIDRVILQLFWFWLSLPILAAGILLVSLRYGDEWQTRAIDLAFVLFVLLAGVVILILFARGMGWEKVERLNLFLQWMITTVTLSLLVLGRDSWRQQITGEIPPIPKEWLFAGGFIVLILWNWYLGVPRLFMEARKHYRIRHNQRQEAALDEQAHRIGQTTAQITVQSLLEILRGDRDSDQ